jgi:hypothetical protein
MLHQGFAADSIHKRALSMVVEFSEFRNHIMSAGNGCSLLLFLSIRSEQILTLRGFVKGANAQGGKMKRIIFGVIWFFALFFGSFAVGGAIVGTIAGSGIEATNMSERFAKAQQAGEAAGAKFGQEYGGVILAGALVVSVFGTVFGVLPGTKKKPPE